MKTLVSKIQVFLSCFLILQCSDPLVEADKDNSPNEKLSKTSLVLLGTTQDAGSPQIGCSKKCCQQLFEQKDESRKVVCLGLFDSDQKKSYLFDATPDLGFQLELMNRTFGPFSTNELGGIFLTHAHIGHYTGLMYLGKEATDAQNIPLFVMPRMKEYLTNNGPWDQLVNRKNIHINGILSNSDIRVSETITIRPILVPHRDEYSETVGYLINGPSKSAVYIPDIDKWSKWDRDIKDVISEVDYAFLDATFYSGKEINNRDISEIPHPFVIESMDLFKDLSKTEKSKIVFIHLNHTNPLLNPSSKEYQKVVQAGFSVGQLGEVFVL